MDRRGSHAVDRCVSPKPRLVFRLFAYSVRQLDFPSPECKAGMEAGRHSDRWIYHHRHWILGWWITVFTMMPSNKSLQATRDGRFQFRFAVHVIWSRVPELWTLGGIAYMSILTRQKLGVSLMCISGTTFMVAWLLTSHSHVTASGSSGHAAWSVVDVESDLSWRYILPIILCGAVGIFCAAWPSRKPPKLPK